MLRKACIEKSMLNYGDSQWSSPTFCLLADFQILPAAHQFCPCSLAGQRPPPQREQLSPPSTGPQTGP